MNTREEAEGGEANHPAQPVESDRNVGAGAMGASSAASGESHGTGLGEGLIERMIEGGNINAAWRQVKGNKGAAGVDGLDIEQSAPHLRQNWEGIKMQLLAGTYPKATFDVLGLLSLSDLLLSLTINSLAEPPRYLNRTSGGVRAGGG
jgi:hypothetical protein